MPEQKQRTGILFFSLPISAQYTYTHEHYTSMFWYVNHNRPRDAIALLTQLKWNLTTKTKTKKKHRMTKPKWMSNNMFIVKYIWYMFIYESTSCFHSIWRGCCFLSGVLVSIWNTSPFIKTEQVYRSGGSLWHRVVLDFWRRVNRFYQVRFIDVLQRL